MKILVVDDQKINRTLPCVLLRQAGCDVEEVESGEAALAALRARPMDAVLLDIGLPGFDGYQVARELRKRPQLQALVLIALSGYGQEEDRRRAREAGFNHHMIKPVNNDELFRVLDTLIASGRA